MPSGVNRQVFDNFPVLESKRLLFRSFELEDAPAFFAIRSDEVTMKYMDSPLHKTVEDSKLMIERIQEDFKEKRGLNWVIEEKESKKMIGYFAYWQISLAHARATAGYALMPDYWRKGYMWESFQVLLPFAFKEMRMHSIEAYINTANEASELLLQRAGFKQEAYLRENYFFDGKFLDTIIYSLLEGDLKTKR